MIFFCLKNDRTSSAGWEIVLRDGYFHGSFTTVFKFFKKYSPLLQRISVSFSEIQQESSTNHGSDFT